MRSLPELSSPLAYRRLAIHAVLLGVLVVFAVFALQGSRNASASSGPIAGIGVLRNGDTYTSGSGYDRYSYVIVGIKDASAAGALPTKSLVYMSGPSVQTSWLTGVSYDDALANGWLLKNSSGQYIKTPYGAYVGDVGSAGYQKRWADNVKAFISSHGNEGVFIDDVVSTPAGWGAFPAKYPTQSAWETAMVSFMAYVGAALRPLGYYVLANAASFIPGDPSSDDGTGYARFYEKLAPYADGLMDEYWEQIATNTSQLRPVGTSSWTQHWDGWLDLVAKTQNAGADFFSVMYGSTTSVAVMRYGKASFLLQWNGGGGGFVYDTASGDPWNPEWTTDIGTPSGSKYQVGVGWRRDYTSGTVILNPSPSSSQTFSLGGTYLRADGSAVTSVTLGPTSALILKRQSTTVAAPSNSALPTITGTAQDGQNLAASTGTWSNSPTAYAYQWKRCDSAGGTCSSISGATSSQYGVGSADVGKTLRVVVTASNSGGSASTTSLQTGVVVAAPGAPTSPPVNTGLPVISGTAQEGLTLASTMGSWSNSPDTYTYQWKRCDSSGAACSAVTGAIASKYVLGSADVGGTLRVVVTASNDAGPASATSAATAVVAASGVTNPLANPTLPTISGTPQQGMTLTSSTGTWSPTPSSYAYQWKRCDSTGSACASIAGATSSQLTLAAADVGKTVRVTVTAQISGVSASATSAASAVIAPPPAAPPVAAPVNTGLPTIIGTPQVGQTLTTTPGTWANSPTSYAYQWRRCDGNGNGCKRIKRATSPQFVPTQREVGYTLQVTVTASNAVGSASAKSILTAFVAPAPSSATSGASAANAPPPAAPLAPANTGLPKITGTVQEGQTLTATTGSWANSPTTYAYEWRRCDPTGNDCKRIKNATSSQFVPTPREVGYTLQLKVTASNVAGSASAKSVLTIVVPPASSSP
jgi:Hypothetical glycosyl hydrolase family 15